MPIATLTNIEKTFGERVLFDKLNLNIYRGERIGLIGDNGSGKSTLFKVLDGQVTLDDGTSTINRSIKLGYLTQDPVLDPANTVMDEAELAFAELHRLSHRMRELEHEMAEVTGEALEKVLRQYEVTQHEFDQEGGYAWQHRLEATLLGIGLPRNTWEQNVATLSGGQRSRLALAKLLISEPDLLLLDEPTNHLDLAAIEWLEKYLADFSGAVVIISHDRFLLDRLATRIVWLNQCRITSYKGNYSAYVEQRAIQELSQQRQFEKQQADIDKQQEFIRRFGAGQRSKEAKGREKRLVRLLRSDALIQQVDTQKKIHLSLNTDQRAGDQVLSARELSKAYDDKQLWKDVAFHVKRGERIGIIGPNGSGKTTLMEVLLGLRDADGGDIKWGANLNIGYYDQKLDDLDPENTIMEEVAEGRDGVKDKELRDVLATMLFRGEDVHKQVGLLSGGERARVRLAELLLDKPNVLLLDEPTNHLDIASCEALENTLRDFPGTILCVSHDRYFLDKVIKRLLVISPPSLVDFEGSYSEWVKKSKAMSEAAAAQAAQAKAKPAVKAKPVVAPKPVAAPKPAATKKKDNPYLRPFGRLSVKEIEEKIAEAEVAMEECQRSLGDPEVFKDVERCQQVQAEHDELVKKLEQLEQEYFLRGE